MVIHNAPVFDKIQLTIQRNYYLNRNEFIPSKLFVRKHMYLKQYVKKSQAGKPTYAYLL